MFNRQRRIVCGKCRRTFRWKAFFGLIIGLVGVAAVSLLAGCWDKRELEDLAFVLATGIDADKDGKILLTAQIAVPARLGGGGGGGGGAGGGSQGPPVLVETISGKSLLDAIDKFQGTSDRRVSFLHNKMIIFGRDLAKRGVHDQMALLTRWREMRRSMFILISDQKAMDILKIQPQQEANPSTYLENLVREDNRVGRIPFIQVNDFLQGLELEGLEAVVPLIRLKGAGVHAGKPEPEGAEGGVGAKRGKSTPKVGEGGKPEGKPEEPAKAASLSGLAVFRKDRMVGELSQEETLGYMLLTGRFRRGILVVPNPEEPDKWVSLFIREAYRRVRVRDLGDPPRFEVRLVLDADFGEIQGKAKLLDLRSMKKVEGVAAKMIRNEALRVIRRSQEDFRADLAGFGELVREKVSPARWARFNWPEVYPQARIDVTVKINLRRIGMSAEPLPPR